MGLLAKISYKLKFVQNTGTYYPGQGWFVGLSPGVADNSSRGQGSMSRYSAQILICFVVYILQFSLPLRVGLGILCLKTACADSAPCPSWSEWRSHSRQSNLPASFARNAGEISVIYAKELMKLTNKGDKIHISGKFFNPATKLMGSFFIHASSFIVFQPRFQTDFSSLELGQLRLFWW